ncbi:flagellar motor protein MotB [Jannaschia sp. W003]|uniref:OmpA/MotB family protein n=1 Tax=Jannaschia sp. W003 TaxID=2867012 RepID=UPI0021A8CB4A|nr:flagellar motor protein MotB [Jannaschia sp. W003]UWQ22469.1 chemotaxis protein MotB [Jannaschia sp. W003]
MSDESQRPIIIKRKKAGGGDGHHGGAWKVAYADFVTAMMAFFMLMWLLNATTEKQRKGLSDYFSPTVPLARSSGGGDGALGGQTLTAADGTVQAGSGGLTERQLQGFGEGEAAAVREAAEAILGKGGDSVLEENDRSHVTVRMTDEGLVIELFSIPGSPLFLGGAVPSPLLERLVRTISAQASGVEAGMALAAHVAREPLVRRDRPAWDLSLARVQALRGLVEQGGLPPTRLRRLTGHGDREPAVAPPVDLRNDRVEIVLLRPDA